MDPPMDTYVIGFRYLHADLYTQLFKALKTMPIIWNKYTCFVFIILGFIVGRLALAVSYNKPSLAEFIGKGQLVYH